MAWPSPQHSKSQVRAAGKRLAELYQSDGFVLVGTNLTPDDYSIIQNWRASHGAVLNTAQAWLRRLEKNNPPVVGQRLKRYETIVDKLGSARSLDLSTMHDIAGVRAIFRSENDLRDFQNKAAYSKAKHTLTHPSEKFDYIESPKDTGYRGVHRVYSRHVPAKSGAEWNGLKFEVQLRTVVQHAWATAVEVFDSTAQARFKFEESGNPAYEQFLVISELFARVHENRVGCLPDMSEKQLVERHRELEEESRMVLTIQNLVVAKDVGALRKNTILQRTKSGDLYAHRFETLPSAIRALADIETSSDTENAVLVGATTPNHIRDAFRNYFDDTSDFVNYLDTAINAVG